ncbi:PREDICTED: uncharacterized protein LOC100634258 [Amphimedon queenslandica]|uniref:DUF8117 domain-containing protein n=1 Tax=Amphimedon queenslandica TaxID=400682 RepID=A0A1X7VSF1_AMPQE|nr:PREDICTED: uncharacterized protein LOC100634258 [Amphimedon queenslandica]|eukprot:XP_011406684.1 PREDICTED: uncharacterized protein LOC100634258 [Amphimedon queenslandica]
MRRIHIGKGDFALFHQDINAFDYEFFRNHSGAFKRMWGEQTRQFWVLYVEMFDHFIWNYGVMKDFPLKIDEVRLYVDEIISSITLSFVEGNATSAKTLITDCAVVAQNRHFIGILDKAPYSQNPFYTKDTRETFRKLFGMPRSKTTFMKVLCGLPVYVKFAGAAVTILRRWLKADTINDEDCIEDYLSKLSSIRSTDSASLEVIERTLTREKRKEEADQPTQRVSKRHFSQESTKQKALEWIDTSKTSVATELEELDPPPKEKMSYRSEYKKTIQSVTEDVRNSLVESIAEVKRKEIELAREKGEDVEPIIEEFKENLAKRKKPRRKKKRGAGPDGGDEISCLLELHKEVSSSDRYLEAIGAKRPSGSLLQPSITEITEEEELEIKIRGKEDTSKAEGESEEKESHQIDGEGEVVSASTASENKECQVEEVAEIILETGEDKSTQTVDDLNVMVDHSTDKAVEMNGDEMGSPSLSAEVVENIDPEPQEVGKEKEESSSVEAAQKVEEDIEKSKVEGSGTGISQQDNKEMERNDDRRKGATVASDEFGADTNKRKALHVCYHCQKKEELAKTFKRCVKCRGKPNPHYYCSRSCQVNDWKAGHRLDHKDDTD